MARFENVLIDTTEPLTAVAATIGEIVGHEPARVPNDHIVEDDEEWFVRLDGSSSVFLAVAGLDDDRDMPLSRYRYLVQVQTIAGDKRDHAGQTRAARQLYDRLAAATDWPLLLAFNDAQEFVARRGRASTAA